jgi:hypothetical protein
MIQLAEKIPSNPNTYQFKHYYEQDIYFRDNHYDKLKYLDLMEKTMNKFHKCILSGKSLELTCDKNKHDKIWEYVFKDFEEWCHYKGYKTKSRDTGLFDPSGIIEMTVFVPPKLNIKKIKKKIKK